MAKPKNLNQYLRPNLELEVGTKLYVIPPPTKKNGLILAAVVTAGANKEEGEEPSQEIQQVLDGVDPDQDFSEMALGKRVFDLMVKDDVPGSHIDRLGFYAMYYWVLGETAADAIFEAQYGNYDDSGETADPKD